MAQIGGAKLTQNTSKQIEKANELLEIIGSIAQKIGQIDEEIANLVKNGMEGSSVQSMANRYIENREVISDYVKIFANSAEELSNSAEDMRKIEEMANIAAGGVN